MRKSIKLTAVGLIAVMMLSGCTTTGIGNKELAGTAVGAGIGGLLGSMVGGGVGKMVGVGLGVAVGGLVGNLIGRELDGADKIQADAAQLKALNSAQINQTQMWSNVENGNSGEFTVTREANRGNQLCREFTQKIQIGGKKEEGVGNACRQADGSWKMVS